MLTKFFFTLALLLATQVSFAKTCVLSLYERDSKYEKIVLSTFKNDARFVIFREAPLNDIMNCFQSSLYSEIIWLSHGSVVNHSLAEYSFPILIKRNDQNQIMKNPLPVFYFDMLSANINYANLKKIRVSTCGLDYTYKSINSDDPAIFNSTIEVMLKQARRNGVSVEISPKFKYGSWILNENVTRLSKRWLKKSITNEDYNPDANQSDSEDEATAYPVPVDSEPLK